jgi:predicted AAA+ superfamily ATPase
LPERPAPHVEEPEQRLLPLPSHDLSSRFPVAGLEERLAFGEMPGIVLLAEEDRAAILRSFVAAHLEEEIRKEALVQDWGAFVNFLRLAASEAGRMVNFAAISQEVGLSLPTVKSHYQLLEDMVLGFRIPAFTRSPRKNLLSTPRFLFVDIGLRHAACGIAPGENVVRTDPGRFLEQWVGAELWKRLHYRGEGQLHYFATKDGAEVDFVVEDAGGAIIPIEVKWTARPTPKDARHLRRFIGETVEAEEGYVICRCPRPQRLTDRVTALPWHHL